MLIGRISRGQTGTRLATLRAVVRVVGSVGACLVLPGCDRAGEEDGFNSALDLVRICEDPAPLGGAVEYETLLPPTAGVEAPSPGDLVVAVSDLATSGGSLYLLDSQDGSAVFIPSPEHAFRIGREGDGPGEFRLPRAIALGLDGNVYVGDDAGRVSVFSPSGSFIRVISVGVRVGDLVVLPDGSLVVATPVARPGQGYVKIIRGEQGRAMDVLTGERWADRRRPLLAPVFNPVRLAMGPEGRFAVFYELDNYIEVFDSQGARIGEISGCVTKETAEHFQRARLTTAPETQPFYEETIGVGFLDSATVVGVHRRTTGWGEGLLFRIYDLGGQELRTMFFEIWNPRLNDPRSPGGDRGSALVRVRSVHFPKLTNTLDDLEVIVFGVLRETGVYRLRLSIEEGE